MSPRDFRIISRCFSRSRLAISSRDSLPRLLLPDSREFRICSNRSRIFFIISSRDDEPPGLEADGPRLIPERRDFIISANFSRIFSAISSRDGPPLPKLGRLLLERPLPNPPNEGLGPKDGRPPKDGFPRPNEGRPSNEGRPPRPRAKNCGGWPLPCLCKGPRCVAWPPLPCPRATRPPSRRPVAIPLLRPRSSRPPRSGP